MKAWLTRIGIALGVVVTLLLVYGVAVEPRLILDEERAEVEMPRLPAEWDGTEIALISDLQIGMWWANTGMVEKAVERAIEAAPDLVLLGGDFVYSSDPGVPQQVDTVLGLLEPLIDSGIPTFAVLGNHDHAVGAADELTSALEERGIAVLRNEAVPLEGDGSQPLYVVGLGPATPDLADVDRGLADVPDDAPRVVLSHNPTVFPELPAGTAPLTVAGHTHCGQVTLPGTPRWSYLGLTEEEEIVAEGWAPQGYGEPGNRMFVTCGIGFSLVPVRINAFPEVAFFELTPAS